MIFGQFTFLSASVSALMVSLSSFADFINLFSQLNVISLKGMPSDLSGGEGNFWYSFDYGFVHYVIFDTETDLGTGRVGAEEPGGSSGAHDGPFGATMNSQLDFLEKDLASVDRFLTPWVIALGHRPWYVNGGACIQCQQAFEPIFNKHNVDVVFSGHVHNYQRQTPIKNNVSDPNGLNNPSSPLYILNGAAGHYDGLGEYEREREGMQKVLQIGSRTHFSISSLASTQF